MRQSKNRVLPAICSLFALCTAFTAGADSAVTTARTVAKIADGIYVIRHQDAPDSNPQGNTTVIVGERTVLVIDTAYLPSSANEDIAQIREWTDKPVRYVLNTHWHPDHQRGNASYIQAFPGVEIVAQTETAGLMTLYDTQNLRRYPERVAALQAQLEKGRDANGKLIARGELPAMREQLAGQQKVLAELKDYRVQLPTLTFDHELKIDLGNRVVKLMHSGAGDTLGDAWAYLPKEKILVTGDVLTAPVPYLFSGYPQGLASTLRELLELDVRFIVPGHGNVMNDQKYMRLVLELIDSVADQVTAAIAQRGSLSARFEDVAKAVDTKAYRKQFAGDDANNQEYFDESIQGLIKDAFYQAPK